MENEELKEEVVTEAPAAEKAEKPKKKKKADVELEKALAQLQNEEKYGVVLRAKGIVGGENGVWLHFDYVPGEADIREGCAIVTGRLCVIGCGLNEDALAELFGA